MRLRTLFATPALLTALVLCGVAPTSFGIRAANADAVLDLRKQIVDFSSTQAKKRWDAEDTMIQRERRFQDGLQQEYRDVALKALRQIKDASNWRDAKRAYRDQVRAETTLLRQKIRVHRDEFDLTLLATYNEFQKELDDFLNPLQQQFRNNKDEAYRKAEDDFDTSREELRDELREWKDRAKDIKTPADFSAN